MFSGAFVCVPRRQGPSEMEWELQSQNNIERERSVRGAKERLSLLMFE